MRLIKYWDFSVGTKPPFSEWPELVHRFLDRHGLSSGAFLYHFEQEIPGDDLRKSRTREEWIASSGIRRMARACPSFGEPRVGVSTLVLSNMDAPGSGVEPELRSLMERSRKGFGLSVSKIYYLDVDFFGETIPWERLLNNGRLSAGMSGEPTGSGVKLLRYAWGEQGIVFSVDLLHHGEVLDPTPYAETMKELLPHRRPREFLRTWFSPEEEREFAARQEAAEPLAEACRDWLARRLPEKEKARSPLVLFPQYKMAPVLKKLAKKYGFEYQNGAVGYFILTRRTARGHFLRLSADSGPSHTEAGFWLEFCGLGFSHRLFTITAHPRDQAEFDVWAERACEAAAEFAEEALSPLDEHYPETPAWYLPQ